MNKHISVLVVDDSAVMRKRLTSVIEASPDLFVVGRARNGIDAVEKVNRYQPNVVILDIEMPEMDGLIALEQIILECPTAVVMLSNDSRLTIQSFSLGAVDFVVKKELITIEESDIARENFHERIRVASRANIQTLPRLLNFAEDTIPSVEIASRERDYTKDLIIIGTSTGGPAALQKLLPRFPVGFSVPILVIQHMPVGFTKPLAERMNQLCSLKVKEAENGERMEAGCIYIAPAGLQTLLVKDGDLLFIQLSEENKVQSLYKPSVDVSLFSVAPVLGAKVLTIILTGMGDDGLKGCMLVKSHGGTVLAESEESCIVYGMPKVIFEAGIVDGQTTIDNMYSELLKHL